MRSEKKRRLTKKKKADNWKNIKPETNTTFKEVEDFWAMEFQKLSEAED